MKRLIFSILALFFLVNPLFSYPPDSLQTRLQKLINSGKYSPEAYELSKKIFRKYFHKSIDIAGQYAALCQNIAENLDDSLLLADSYILLGKTYMAQGTYFMATQVFFKALDIYRNANQQTQIANTLLNIAETYIYQDIADIALEKLSEAERIFLDKHDTTGVAKVLYFKGLAYMSDDEYTAINYLKEALNLFEKLNLPGEKAKVLYALGKIYYSLEDFDSAKFFTANAEKFFSEQNDTLNLAKTYLLFSKIFYQNGNYKKSGDLLDKAIKLFNSFHRSKYLTDALILKSQIAINQKDYNKATEILDTALLIAENYRLLEEKTKIYKILSNLYEEQNNLSKAIEYYHLYVSALEELYDFRKIQQFSSVQMNLENQTKAKELELFKMQTEKQRVEMERSQYRRNMIYGAVITFLTLILIVFLIIRNREKNKNEQLLRDTNLMLKHEIEVRKKAQEVMQESEERYKLLFKKSPVGILYFEENLVVTEVNDRFLEIFNMKRNEIVKKTLDKIFDRNTVRTISEFLDSKDELFKLETKLISKNKVIFVQLTIKKYELDTDYGKKTGGIIIIEDLTEQKKAEHQLKTDFSKIQKIFKLFPDNLILTDFDGNILELILPNAPDKEISTTTIDQILPKEIMVKFNRYFILAQEKRIKQQFIVESKQGKLFIRIIPDFNAPESLIIITNISKSEIFTLEEDQKQKFDKKKQLLLNLRSEIENELLGTYQNIQRGMSFVMLKNFAEKILKIGEKYNNKELKQYGTELMEALTSFNVFKVNDLIENFPIFISKFTEQGDIIF